MTAILKIVYDGRSSDTAIEDYVGLYGEFLLDRVNGEIRFLDGETPGGTIIGAGGGSLRGFDAGFLSDPPNDTVGVSVLGTDAETGTQDISILTNAGGAFMLSLPTGDSQGGNKRGSYAVDLQMQQSGKNSPTAVASAPYSFACNIGNTASGQYSFVSGFTNTASGDASHAEGSGTTALQWAAHAEGNGTTAGGASSHAEGAGSSATGDSSHAEGLNASASATAAHAEGENTTASGEGAHAEGVSTIADGAASHASGQDSVTRGISYYQGYSTGGFQTQGDQQTGRLGVKLRTSTNTQATLTSDAGPPSTTNQILVPTDSAVLCQGNIVARDRTNGNSAAYSFVGLLKNVSGTVSIVGSPTITNLFHDTGAASWAVALAADSGNSAVSVKVTGAATTDIFWSAEIRTQEVITGT